jgi:hypothetical protein
MERAEIELGINHVDLGCHHRSDEEVVCGYQILATVKDITYWALDTLENDYYDVSSDRR